MLSLCDCCCSSAAPHIASRVSNLIKWRWWGGKTLFSINFILNLTGVFYINSKSPCPLITSSTFPCWLLSDRHPFTWSHASKLFSLGLQHVCLCCGTIMEKSNAMVFAVLGVFVFVLLMFLFSPTGDRWFMKSQSRGVHMLWWTAINFSSNICSHHHHAQPTLHCLQRSLLTLIMKWWKHWCVAV